MTAVLLRDVRRFCTPRLVMLMLGCLLFSLAKRKGFSYSYEHFVLHMLSDHYYITFFMVPMFLYIIYSHLEDDLDYVLIRIKKFPRYFAVKSAAIGVNISIFVLLQLAVILAVGLGLPGGSGFPPADTQDSSIEVLLILGGYFQYPWQGSALTVLHMVLGLSVLGSSFMAMHHFFEKRWVAIITVGLFFLMVYAMKSKIPELTRIPFLFINNYIIFMYNLTFPYSFWVTYISLGMIAGGTAFWICRYWNKELKWQLKWRKPRGVLPYYGAQLFSAANAGILIVLIVLLSLWKWPQLQNLTGGTGTIADWMVYTFWGHGHGYFRPSDFLAMMLMNSAPVCLIAVFLQREWMDHSTPLTIRLASKRQWGCSVVGISSLFLLTYTVLLTAGSLLFPSFTGLPAGGVTILPGIEISLSKLWLYITAMKGLELLFQFLCMLLIFLWSRQVTAAFGGIVLMYAFYFLPYGWTQYVPVGMSSLSQHQVFAAAAEPGVPALSGQVIFLIMGLLTIILALYILIYGYKRRFR
ncbi:hypothetical protein [Paenibacillus lemnae]|uniref:Uncharacterized protein n=1 Tax=Paenibacillus lemnae TaxID=1330551 RepID=A0A848M6D3_PAELE|nr:hypothetical protein [Paenibacillus lemnae]NMO95771.1 hypothetical protein [Paenibacillus lemnae]